MEIISAIYHIDTDADAIESRALGVALEQTVELPPGVVQDPFVLENVLGRVQEIIPQEQGFRVVVEYPVGASGLDPAQLLNVLFGNTSLQPDVMLLDATFPPSLTARFPGPRFGIPGLRERLQVQDRPLTCTALKPMGASPEELARLCRLFARAGIDIIKDDHGLADQEFAPFEERVRACQAAVEEVAQETGRRVIYAPNIMGAPGAMRRQLELAQELDVQVVMMEPMLTGFPGFYELVTELLEVPVLAHPALSGAVRIAPPLLLGKLCRLYGADGVIYPHFGGRFAYSQETCQALARNLRQPWGRFPGAFPIPAGGMQVERVDELVRFYGPDTILLIGGSLYRAGSQLRERSQEFVRRVQQAASQATSRG